MSGPMQRPPGTHRIGRREAWAVAGALLLYWLMAVSVSPRLGVTADEIVHLTGGYTYWQFNDYRMHPENGTLPMRVAALPLLAMDLQFPPLDHPHWLNSKVNLVGLTFFHELGNPVERMLLYARAMVALFGALTCWIVWRWARALFGRAGGAIALALSVLCPALLAHGGLATSDIALTACILLSLSLAWRLLHRVTWARLLATGTLCGLTFLAKMSGVFLLPVLALLVLARTARGTPLRWELGRGRWVRGRGAILLHQLGVGLLIGALGLVVLWAGYGFRYEGFNRAASRAEDYYFGWEVILDREPVPQPADTSLDQLLPTRRPLQETTMTRLIGAIREHRLLPEAYLWGFAHTYKFSRYRPAFFNGQYRTTGWRTFFPAAFWWKTTPAALLLVALGGLTWIAHRRQRLRWLYRAAPLLVFFVFYWAMSINMSLNIGHRHILPTYPVFYLVAAASAGWLLTRWRRPVAVGLIVLLAGHATESLLARPFYLSYFQPLAGPAKHHQELLVDSSLDWGQGLPDLAAWLEAKKQAGDRSPVFLTYFGADSPRARGLDVIRFGDEVNDHGLRTYPAPVRGGWFVVSATHFQRVYLPTRGPNWTDQQERLYRTLLERRRLAADGQPDPRHSLTQDLMDIEILQFSRLTHFLHQREPVEVIGRSLLVFQLTDAEVAQALYGQSPPPVAP